VIIFRILDSGSALVWTVNPNQKPQLSWEERTRNGNKHRNLWASHLF